MKSTRTLLAAAAAMMAGAAASPALAETPVVVELFTSQGCSSCPPADEYLGELAQKDGVIALGWHVSYWDYIGWKDPFASERFTERQRAYSRYMGERMVYTPQMVIDGRRHAVGSDRPSVTRLIDAARQTPKIAVSVENVEDAGWRISVGDSPSVGTGVADVLWVLYLPESSNAVDAGENRGRKLSNYNIVRALVPLGEWRGEAKTFAAPDDDEAGLRRIVLLQNRRGAIIGAADVDGPRRQTAATPPTPRSTPLPAGG